VSKNSKTFAKISKYLIDNYLGKNNDNWNFNERTHVTMRLQYEWAAIRMSGENSSKLCHNDKNSK
jgi:hypothetical protein